MKAKINTITILILLAINISYSQVTYTWVGGNSSNFTSALNWSPVRANGQVSDILVFNTGTTVNALNVQQQTIGQLIITNNTHLILTPASGNPKILSIYGCNGTDVAVDSGSTLEINGTTPQLGILLKTGATASIYGNVIITGNQAHYLNALDSNAIHFHSGSSLTQSTPGYIFTNTGMTNVAIFENGSSLIITNSLSKSPFGFAYPNSKVVFSNECSYVLQANDSSAIDFNGRTYGNLVLDYHSSITVNEAVLNNSYFNNITITNGSILSFTNSALTSNPTFSIKGSLNVNGSFSFINKVTCSFDGNNQTISGNGTISIPVALINSNVTLLNCKLQSETTVSENGSITSNNGYAVGKLTKYFTSTNKSRNFEIGTMNGFSPVNVTFNSISTNGYITVSSTAMTHTLVADSTKEMRRYWTVSNNGVEFDYYKLSFTYLSADFNTNLTEATDEATMQVINFSGNHFSRYLNSRISYRDTLNNIIGIDSVHTFGDFTNNKSLGISTYAGDDINTMNINNNTISNNIPKDFSISQNYPNPFNPTTKIDYTLPVNSKVTIKLYDMTGKEISELLNANQNAGSYTIQVNGLNLASGVYFYKIIAGSSANTFEKTLKMVLAK